MGEGILTKFPFNFFKIPITFFEFFNNLLFYRLRNTQSTTDHDWGRKWRTKTKENSAKSSWERTKATSICKWATIKGLLKQALGRLVIPDICKKETNCKFFLFIFIRNISIFYLKVCTFVARTFRIPHSSHLVTF